MSAVKRVDLNVSVDVLTAGSAAEVTNEILKFLLYQRNQIPIVYKMYKYFVGKWAEQTEQQHGDQSALQNYQVQLHRQQAKQTKEAICNMQELITEAFEKTTIRSLRFLFGATAFTPKEAYTVHIPIGAISQKHCHDHHRISHGHLNQVLLSLLSNEELYETFSKNLVPTNVYLELETAEEPQSNGVSVPKMSAKDAFQLPASCRDIHIYLQYTHPLTLTSMSLNCCKELQIFEDFTDLNISGEHFDEKHEKDELETCTSAWWEANIVVRGFKEKQLKGINIWAN